MAEIESDSLQAVSSLRSKFESLSTNPMTPTTPTTSPRRSLSPTPRPVSPTPSFTKRPPPPPLPASRSRGPSPSPTFTPSSSSSATSLPSISPLLRPVPIPPVRDETAGGVEMTPSSSVSALRSKFMNTPNTSSDDKTSPRKPIVPPRIGITEAMPEQLIPVTPNLPERIPSVYHSQSSSNSSSLLDDSPIDSASDSSSSVDDTTTILSPKNLIARKPPPPPSRSSTASSTASVSDTTPTKIPPPRPPPRHRATPESLPEISTNTTLTPTSLSPPPPLPARRSTVENPPPRHPQSATTPNPPPHPPLPSRHAHSHSFGSAAEVVSSPIASVSSTNLALHTSTQLTPPSLQSTQSTSALLAERRKDTLLGLKGLPPPPTRTIGLGDKLPPARRPPTPESDEDESESEEDGTAKGIDTLPDASRSSRRPPYLQLNAAIGGVNAVTVPAYTGHVVMSNGFIIVGAGHHLRVWDTGVSLLAPIFDLHTSGWGAGKEPKVTSLCVKGEGEGWIVWVGTKEGHLVEVDVRAGRVLQSKLSAHLHPVVGLFRYRENMISVDEGGKVLIFSPSRSDGELIKCPPRVLRITDKLEFCHLLTNGCLWTSSRTEVHLPNTPNRVPIIRIYDLFQVQSPSNTPKTVFPIEHCGSVTSCAVLPTSPQHVYLGHEEGYISIWNAESYTCEEVIKISNSDILSMEAVGSLLWVGQRNGFISAYKTMQKPWEQTNSFAAHTGVPVVSLVLDVNGISTRRRLAVLSVGRDEKTALWDGLLKREWVEGRVGERENEYASYEGRKVGIATWNCDSAKPADLDGLNAEWLVDMLRSFADQGGGGEPDIISFGLQEVIDLESRKMTAKNVILGNKKKGLGKASSSSSSASTSASASSSRYHHHHSNNDSALSTRITGAYKRWYDALVLAVRLAYPPEIPYVVVHAESLVGLFSCVFVKKELRGGVREVGVACVKRGMGGRYGNKGGIITRFILSDSSICFVNCHLAAGQHALRSRNADVAGILEERDLFDGDDDGDLDFGVGATDSNGVGGLGGLAGGGEFVGGGDGSMVLDHEVVFWNGDMNYRIDQRRDNIIAAVQAGEHTTLLAHDQLLKEVKYNKGYRLRSFQEGFITFAPTYKYDRRSDTYDSSEKKRAPAWCDRILWHVGSGGGGGGGGDRKVEQVDGSYRRWEVNVSDHRPVSAVFNVKVKSVRSEVRGRVREEVGMRWIEEEEQALGLLKEWYRERGLL
ncbi:type i inositol- -trisphosphate 5-phosphatase 11 [Moniliophthora roreri MCA 2997]|uniref:Type i inositol--trisphosphate 5-phosphatase 11 n=1 Tax=Moniliophthora roreri (strain MCA 2997) TaxID=1381753 RepID=V2XRA3_MONRO|nr:type i inositol- -trisphosphate 5-phosphatase 11 [Moniliophthora roreri MCA 2997]KAI3610101.1 type i inositol--trisphosphate 5-phosphatase 11 [Moniliophthora roreri]